MRRKLGTFLAAGTILIGLTFNCGKTATEDEEGGGAASSSNVTVAGTLALTGTSLRLTDAPALTDLTVYCVTFEMPPKAGTGAIGADGAFSVTLESAKDIAIGCFILKADKSVVGSLVFENPNEKSLDGGNKTNDKMAFSGTTSLGAISLDLKTGQAKVDISKVSTAKTASTIEATAAFDFTGTYKATSQGITLPDGFTAICPEGAQDQGKGEGCNGPMEGMSLWLQRVVGVKAGTTDPAYGMSIWAAEDAYKTCGSKLGFTYAEGIAHGIDFTTSGVAEGDFTWTAGYVDGWKKSDATAGYSIGKEENVADFKGLPGSLRYFSQYRTCTDTTNPWCHGDEAHSTIVVGSGFEFYANSDDIGCKVNGEPYQLNDWENMSCTGADLTGTQAGLHKSTCTRVLASSESKAGQTVTCLHIGGMFTGTAANSTPLANGWVKYGTDFVTYANGPTCSDGKYPNWSENGASCSGSATLTLGQTCASIDATTEPGKLAQLKCYADAYWKGGGDDMDTSKCLRNINANFNAKTSAEFLGNQSGPVTPRSNFVFEKFEYAGPNAGFLRGEETYFRGIQVGDNWTDCEINEVFTLSFIKDSTSNDLLTEMISNETNISDKPACVAKYGAGVQTRYYFKMVKQ